MDVAVEQQPSTSGVEEKGETESGANGQTKQQKKQQHKNKWKMSKFKKKKQRHGQTVKGCGGGGVGGTGDQNQNTETIAPSQPNRKHGGHKNGRPKRQVFSNISKFFLPDKLPRKARVIPPTKFLLGGNISDPLNLNSLQNESENACTPKSSPVPTQNSVEVLIPPNIHDPLHLMDPVDSVEYEMQLCSPMKRKTNKHRHRKRRKSSKENAEGDVEVVASADVSIESASTEPVLPTSEVLSTSNPERVVKNLKLELGEPSTGRKRRCSESSTQKTKSKRLDLDKIVSPVIPQHNGWKRAHKPSRPPLRRSRSQPHSESEKPKAEEKSETDTEEKVEPMKKGEKYRYGNYDRYYGYRHLNEYMDVRLKVFHRNRQFFKDKDVLDVGCNVGLLTISVAKMLQPKSICGVDIDKNLINRARNNLNLYVRVPEDERPSLDQPGTSRPTEPRKRKRRYSRRYSRQPKCPFAVPSQRSEFFPMSMPMCMKPMPTLGEPEPSMQVDPLDDEYLLQFPDNVFFRAENYVPKDETVLQNVTQQYDLILCLSVSKWMHLNFGDIGLKLAFKKMFNQLRPGGKLILEAQNWASYKKKKRISDTVQDNYKTIRFFPKKFNEYLLSTEVGFSHSYPLGIPRHLNKGFSRPIQLYVKGDFTPNHAQWSDYHLSQTPYQTPRDPHHTKYFTNMLLGNLTPFASHGSYSYRVADPSPYYNPLATDSYLPSYDNETTRRTYCFASPLYSTTWSPPTNEGSRSGSLQNTPRRATDGDDSNWRPHVYPPTGDDFGQESGKLSSRSADNDYTNSPVNSPSNHVYAVEPVLDDKQDSQSPHRNNMEQCPEQLIEAALPEQNGIHDCDEEIVEASSSPRT